MTVRDFPSRNDQRRDEAAETRVRLLEQDADRFDQKFAEVRTSIDRLTRAAWWVAGLFTTATISLVVNFLFGKITTGGH